MPRLDARFTRYRRGGTTLARRDALRLGLLGSASLALAACGSSSNGNGKAGSGAQPATVTGGSATTPAAVTPARAAATPSLATPVSVAGATPGGTVRLVAQDVANYDYQVSFSVLQTLYMNRLLRYRTGAGVDPNQYDIIPDLAAGYETPSPTQIVFSLHRAARFHDKPPVNGRALDSDDVKATFALLSSNQPQYVYRYLVDFIDKVEASTPDTVAITLKYPTQLIFNTLAYYNSAIAPREIVERDGNLQKVDVGTGPFTFDRYDKGAGYDFKKNPSYFRAGAPYLDAVQLNVIADPSAQLDALGADKIDALDLSVDQLAAAKRSLGKAYSTVTEPGVGWTAFVFNAQQQPFSDLRVRQAFHYALDRQAIATLVANGNAAIRTGPVARGWPQWTRSDDAVNKDATRDVQKAKQLLAAAGFGNGLQVEWIYGPYAGSNGQTQRIAQVAQEQWKDAGIAMKITILDNAA